MTFATRFIRALGPAIAAGSPVEAVRAGVGALVGLAVSGLFILSPSVDTQLGLYLIAPFGASAVLLFAVPNSPLAQPFSAVVGNTLGALVGVAVCLSVPDPAWRIAFAVGLAITVMILCRAVHPPAGAVAMTAAMSPDAVAEMGFLFALTPVAAGTILLVLLAVIYARLTGRHYPFRHFDDPNAHGTKEPPPVERTGLSEAELTDILERYRQSFNLGVEDLARLIGAAEIQAATHHTGPLTAADIMSRDLVTVLPDSPDDEIAHLFRRHRFTSLPVTDADGRYLGVIFQFHLIAQHGNVAPRSAREMMDADGPVSTAATPVAALLPLMAEGHVDAVPVLDGTRIIGIVTRTDLIAALARASISREA